MPSRTTTLALLAVALIVSGCAPQAATQPRTPASQPKPPTATQLPDPPKLMPPSEKRSRIASSFPAEVPVVVGRVVRGRAQGADAWDYVIDFDDDADLVSTWYQMAYGGRGWALTAEAPSGLDGIELTFRKGTAESRITVQPLSGGATRVSAIVGVGAPVLDTQ